MATKIAPKKQSKTVGMYIEVPRELRDLVDELKIPKAETARVAFIDAVKKKAGENALGKKVAALTSTREKVERRPSYGRSQQWNWND